MCVIFIHLRFFLLPVVLFIHPDCFSVSCDVLKILAVEMSDSRIQLNQVLLSLWC